MVIDELLKIGVTLVEGNEYSNPILESILVLSNLLDVDKTYIYIHGKKEVNKDIEDRFIKIMKKRKTGYPIQYILGEREFMGLNFHVEEGVLIPRPETELMVEYIIDYINKEYPMENINVLDLGIGSGAISLSIGKYCANTMVYGVDIEYKPIYVGNINKDRFNLSNVNFYQGDLFEAIEDLDLKNKIHIIASNPPYIKTKDLESLQKDVRDFEPKTALDGGEDGLDFYRKISHKSKNYLIHGGLLIYEIGYDQGNQVKSILDGEGFTNISILKDLQGHDRVVLGFME
ncbi:peptide chain release factor N(5)-glutamine methyltransferase [Wansuia hejianensis]|uniref:Release factor glutamine methyltransferase n=1 Tax=Wansuia hejianensis TaxID=2763667 RepID=A0A926F157_9FIRM|nr:peptide chain release factor N(5)-glutamine methyltransferase [Wansuia hejianensis]